MLTLVEKKSFANGHVFLLKTEDGYLIETTDTFLPFYTKDAVGRKQNALTCKEIGSRRERWMIGVSVMSGCPVRCKFCATGLMKRWRNLTSEEIQAQVDFVLAKNPKFDPAKSNEFKINYTRMGEPFLNIEDVKKAISVIDSRIPNTHHYISTIGIKGADYSWIKNNITLQVSLHSLNEERRDDLIPFPRKVAISELGKIKTGSKLKTTLNLTLVDDKDFDIEKLKENFATQNFFVKLSPINPNVISEQNNMGNGIIEQQNLI